MAKDHYNSINKYHSSLDRFRKDETISENNRKIVLDWLKWKQEELEFGFNNQEEKEKARIRFSKTLDKYVLMLRNVATWFPDLSNISKQDLQDFKKDFDNDKLRSYSGKMIRSKTDYYSKVFRSDFFKRHLGLAQEVADVFYGRIKRPDSEVQYLDESDVKKIVEWLDQETKLGVLLMFSTSIRVGTLLNLRKRDFEMKHNLKTNNTYFNVHIKAEFTKSNKSRTTPCFMPEANELLMRRLERLSENEHVISVTYRTIYNRIENAAINAKVTTKPDGLKVSPHSFRRSTCLWLIKRGIRNESKLKAWLGHSPGSNIIRRYLNYAGVDLEEEGETIQQDYLGQTTRELESVKAQMLKMEQEREITEQKIKKLQSDADLFGEAYHNLITFIKTNKEADKLWHKYVDENYDKLH